MERNLIGTAVETDGGFRATVVDGLTDQRIWTGPIYDRLWDAVDTATAARRQLERRETIDLVAIEEGWNGLEPHPRTADDSEPIISDPNPWELNDEWAGRV